MHRKKPQSGKAKKEELKTARAIKAARGSGTELPAPSKPKAARSHVTTNIGRGYRLMSPDERRLHDSRKSGRSALESRFIKLPADYVEYYKNELAQKPFLRPVQASVAVLRETVDEVALTCPKRPKWRYTMSKKEVEKNEEAMFEKWLADTDSKQNSTEDTASGQRHVAGYFERNLAVWRQLWRVTEASEILLILLDVRCPLLHFPQSLRDYTATLKPRKQFVLVLTKVDLVPMEIAQSWQKYLEMRYNYPVTMVESYKERAKSARTQGVGPRYTPGTSADTREAVVNAVQQAHADLSSPPPWVLAKPEKVAAWKPRLRQRIDWQALRNEHVVVPRHAIIPRASDSLIPGKAEQRKARRFEREIDVERKARLQTASAPMSAKGSDGENSGESSSGEDTDDEDGDHVTEPPFLSIGLIGQPNVGKSSLLNALLSKKVVRASRTPGKTKSLQTIFWTPEVRLVDCPGLVFPSSVGLERQVLSGILPIQNVESVIYELGQIMPLEKALNLPTEQAFSTDSLLSSYAIDRGYLTAKAARPDIYRAGSLILRAVQSSQIPWSFQPPEVASSVDQRQEGVWLSDWQTKSSPEHQRNLGEIVTETEGDGGTTSLDESTELSASQLSEDEGEASDGVSTNGQSRHHHAATGGVGSAFAALNIESGQSDDEGSGDDSCDSQNATGDT